MGCYAVGPYTRLYGVQKGNWAARVVSYSLFGGQGVRAARMGRHGYVWELTSITDGLLDKAIE